MTFEPKIVLLGDESVGKTSIVAYATGQSFDPTESPTIGAQLFPQSLSCDEGTITVRIWDTAGQERYRSLAPRYYQGSDVAIVVFSVVYESSFAGAKNWITELNEQMQVSPKIFIVGNKNDLPNPVVSIGAAVEFAETLKADYFETSAKTGDGILDLFAAVARYLLTRNDAVEEVHIARETGCRC
jgi:small GTP-binding protein